MSMRVLSFVLLLGVMAHFAVSQSMDNPEDYVDDMTNKWKPPSLIPGPSDDSPTLKCSRLRSRIVRGIIEEQVMPTVEDAGYFLPKECLLSRANDILRLQEEQKHELWREQWKCLLCGKSFRSEFYLDKHMENKHTSLYHSNATCCLADLCEMFDCESGIEEAKSRNKNTPYSELDNVPLSEIEMHRGPCKENVMDRRKAMCEAVLHKCFSPDKSDSSRALFDTFERRFCARLSCSPAMEKLKWKLPVSGKWRKFYGVLVFILVGSLAVFYALFFYTRRKSRSGNDLRRLSRSRLFSRKTKAF
mmetsp:Transcript_44015/g.71631  ORF Transcript_44015/g.71631 Transcript_44015/m.71631 type:complete len:303 (-) Transcript_44015:2381-3289(-)